MRLRQADHHSPGIRRIRRGRGFSYVDENGVVDEDTRTRIQALVIPPAWTDVWICPHANGHLQAIGTDSEGRRQYLYHREYRVMQDKNKFDHMLEFADCLPSLRDQVRRDLAGEDHSKAQILAVAVRLLDELYMRVGSEQYETYGLATLQKQHVRVQEPNTLHFKYTAKHGVIQEHELHNKKLFEIISYLKHRQAGQELLAYKDIRGRWQDINSHDINEYIARYSCGTAKDFRTWNATVLASIAVAKRADEPDTDRIITETVKEVATRLGNTPAVCKSAYIDPRVWERLQAGVTLQTAYTKTHDKPSLEQAVMALLRGYDQAHVTAAINH